MVHIKQSQRAAHPFLLIFFMCCGYFKGAAVPDPKFRSAVLCNLLYHDPPLWNATQRRVKAHVDSIWGPAGKDSSGEEGRTKERQMPNVFMIENLPGVHLAWNHAQGKLNHLEHGRCHLGFLTSFPIRLQVWLSAISKFHICHIFKTLIMSSNASFKITQSKKKLALYRFVV